CGPRPYPASHAATRTRDSPRTRAASAAGDPRTTAAANRRRARARKMAAAEAPVRRAMRGCRRRAGKPAGRRADAVSWRRPEGLGEVANLTMRVLILGAGVIGTTTAWYATESGHEAIVLDRREGPALETSFANGGQISAGHSEPWAN